MSAAIRTALAAAANTHLGANKVTPYYRQTTTAGWGWVSMGRRDRDASGFGFLDTWEIRVVLSSDIAKAEKWIDQHSDALTAAVAEEVVVTSLTPAILNLDSKTTVNALIIEGVREH
jgi:hypothetical protein